MASSTRLFHKYVRLANRRSTSLLLAQRIRVVPLHRDRLRKTPCCFYSFSSRAQLPAWSSSSDESIEQNVSTISIYDMDSQKIRNIDSFQDLTALVEQMQSLPTLMANDIPPLVLPLAKACFLHGLNNQKLQRSCAELIQKMILHCLARVPTDLSLRDDDSPFPPVQLYRFAIAAWGRLRDDQAAYQAERLFQLMLSEYLQEYEYAQTHRGFVVRTAAPERSVYEALLRTWSLSDAAKGPARANEILRHMERLSGLMKLLGEDVLLEHERKLPVIEPPDRLCYNLVLSAYARRPVLGYPHVVNRVKQIIERMDSLRQILGDDEYRLDHYSYQAVFRCYGQFVGSKITPIEPRYADEIQALIDRVQKQDRETGEGLIRKIKFNRMYGYLIEALLKTPPLLENVRRADSIVVGLVEQHQDLDIEASPYTWPRQDTLMKVIQGWKKANVPDLEDKWQRLLRIAVHTPFRRLGELNVAMESWEKSGWDYTPQLLESMLFRSLEDRSNSFQPNGQSFAIAIRVWLRVKTDDAPHRAEIILQRMIEQFRITRNTLNGPRDIHLRLVIQNWLNRCGDKRRYHGLGGYLYPAEHIESLLMWLQNEPWIRNHVGLFCQGIGAWSRQKLPSDHTDFNPVQRAHALLNALYTHVEALTPFPCNALLQTCQFPQSTEEGRCEAYNVAMETFAHNERNAWTYVLVLRVIKAHIDPIEAEHFNFIEELFEDSCARGMLSQELIWEVVSVVPIESLKLLFAMSHHFAETIVHERDERLCRDQDSFLYSWKGRPPSYLMVENLPLAWSQNVQRKEGKVS